MITNPTRDCLAEVKTALNQRGDAWRIASLATVDIQGIPQVRSVVLRDVNLTQDSIIIFTDRRSGKVADIRQQPQCSVLLWCPDRQQQWRMHCIGRVLEDNTPYWQAIANSRSIKDYATSVAPGTTLENGLTFDIVSAEQHFCVIELEVRSIDRLWLSKEGHRRQHISTDGVRDICP